MKQRDDWWGQVDDFMLLMSFNDLHAGEGVPLLSNYLILYISPFRSDDFLYKLQSQIGVNC
jgi:hypothetical protein